MTIILMLLTTLAVVVLAAVLIYFLSRIIEALVDIGGEASGYSSRASYLAKLAFGLRAIEQQTSHLGPEVTRLNEGLVQAAGGLSSIEGHLSRTIAAVSRQEIEQR